MDKQKAKAILLTLKKHYPKATISLNYSNNFELLISVMLSAQTTDLQVNKVTSVLFPKYKLSIKGLEDKYNLYKSIKLKDHELIEIINFAFIDLNQLEKDISSIGLFRTKAKNIQATAKILIEKYQGLIPKTMQELIELPGVGRKTANVVLGDAFGISEGIAVDTHVKRLSLKYGFTKNTNPEKIEKDLMNLFDKKDWILITFLLIKHGRNLNNLKQDFILE